MEINEDGFVFSDDPQLVDVNTVHRFLSEESYWAKGISLEIVKRSIANSLCFGIYKANKQVGFARWITDKATFAHLCDVFIIPDFRGKGLSKKLMVLMLFHPDLQGLRAYQLSTLDAHGLYEQFGFKMVADPSLKMEISIKDIYLKENGS
jgi:N-acetylglutamate synthase-like GNAT family acetyltransferase